MEIGIRYKRYKVCEQAYTSIPYTFLNFVWLKISDFLEPLLIVLIKILALIKNNVFNVVYKYIYLQSIKL